MKRARVVSILFAILLVSCARVEAAPTQGVSSGSSDPAATTTSLALATAIGDGGLLSGLPCPSPCAFGIHIGETQLDQVIPVLANNGISQCSTEPNLAWSLISCSGSRFNVQVDMRTSRVNAVWFDPAVPITLGEIAEKYGEPDYVTMDQDAPGTLHPRLYWTSIRMLVSLPALTGQTYDVTKATEVEAIDFSDEALYRTAEKASDPCYGPWKGFSWYRPVIETLLLTPIPTATTTQ